jgi:hypothetical protein
MQMSSEDPLNMDQLQADLRRRENELAPEVAERLLAARREAVRVADSNDARPWVNWLGWQAWAATGALASGVLVVAIMLQTPSLALPAGDEVELAAAQEIELLEELEFVAWMVALEDEDSPTSG